MSQLALLDVPIPAPPSTIDLRCCDVAEVLREVRGAALVHADPPWGDYEQRPGVAAPDLAYDLLAWEDIDAHLTAARDCATDARLVLWACWPLVMERIARGQRVLPGEGWRWVTGGAWEKQGRYGVGYHWIGASEPVMVGTTGRPRRDTSAPLVNAHASQATDHSEKPVEWLRGMLRRWTRPGDLVLDLYAGLAPMARACMAEGRRYVGAEIDPERHQQALMRLASYGS